MAIADPDAVALLPSQMAAILSTAPVIGRPAGYGSGKSVGLVAWAVHRGQALAVPGGPPVAGLLVEPTIRQIKRVLLPRLRDFCKQHQITHRHRVQDGEWHMDFGNGATCVIMLGSTDRPTTLEGPTVAFAGMDEAGHVRDASAFRSVNARLRWPTAGMTPQQAAWCNQLHLCGTPEGTGSHFWEWCQGPTGIELGTDVIRGGTMENHWLPPSPAAWIASKLGHLGPDERAAYVDGRFVAAGGRVLQHYDPARNERPMGDRKPASGDLYMFCDFGFRTCAWVLATMYRPDVGTGGQPVIHIFDEIIGRNTTTETQRELASQRWMQHLGPRAQETSLARVTVVPDETSRGDIALLRQHGFHTLTPRKQNPGWRDRAHTLNQLLRQGRLLVDAAAAPYAAACMRDLGWGRDGKPLKTTDDGSGDRAPLDHGFDAIGYGCHRLLPVSPHRPGAGEH